jgi:hypothetical protein
MAPHGLQLRPFAASNQTDKFKPFPWPTIVTINFFMAGIKNFFIPHNELLMPKIHCAMLRTDFCCGKNILPRLKQIPQCDGAG